MHVRHFLKAEVSDLYPAIKFEAILSADTNVRVPLRCTVWSSIVNGAPAFCEQKESEHA